MIRQRESNLQLGSSVTTNEYYNTYYKLKRGEISNWRVPIQSIVNVQKKNEIREISDLGQSVISNTKNNMNYLNLEKKILSNFKRSIDTQFANTALKDTSNQLQPKQENNQRDSQYFQREQQENLTKNKTPTKRGVSANCTNSKYYSSQEQYQRMTTPVKLQDISNSQNQGLQQQQCQQLQQQYYQSKTSAKKPQNWNQNFNADQIIAASNLDKNRYQTENVSSLAKYNQHSPYTSSQKPKEENNRELPQSYTQKYGQLFTVYRNTNTNQTLNVSKENEKECNSKSSKRKTKDQNEKTGETEKPQQKHMASIQEQEFNPTFQSEDPNSSEEESCRCKYCLYHLQKQQLKKHAKDKVTEIVNMNRLSQLGYSPILLENNYEPTVKPNIQTEDFLPKGEYQSSQSQGKLQQQQQNSSKLQHYQQQQPFQYQNQHQQQQSQQNDIWQPQQRQRQQQQPSETVKEKQYLDKSFDAANYYKEQDKEIKQKQYQEFGQLTPKLKDEYSDKLEQLEKANDRLKFLAMLSEYSVKPPQVTNKNYIENLKSKYLNKSNLKFSNCKQVVLNTSYDYNAKDNNSGKKVFTEVSAQRIY